MGKEDKNEFIKNIQEIIKSDTGIKPPQDTIEKHVIKEDIISPKSPHWMRIIEEPDKAKLN